MADIELVIKIDKETYNRIMNGWIPLHEAVNLIKNVQKGTPIPEVHGRLGDLDELEQRISNFVEYDAKINDEHTVIRERFIVDGIRQTPTVIEADKTEREE